ncbi:CvpA family protein [bacterium]|nr:CvpA family protein [bacterium]MCB2179360.1 CvpA family protein [bacterium]
MLSLTFVFYLFVFVTAVIGIMRGWAKETLVIISTILALFIIFVFENYVGIYRSMVYPQPVVINVAAGQTCEDAAAALGVSTDQMIKENNLTPDCIITAGMRLEHQDNTTRFWVSTTIILTLAFFGYQTPAIKLFQNSARREKIRDAVLGAVFGAFNGYLMIGSIWWFLSEAGYENFSKVMIPPIAGTEMATRATELLSRMPPEYLMQAPHIYITIAIAFAFVVIVFV